MAGQAGVVGMRVEEIDTPALLIDLPVMEANIERMAEFFRGLRANLRPHVKTHKTPALAHKQLAAGAQGITCAKLGEAEVMAAAGIRDILIANEIVGERKIARLMNLARHADVMAAVDDPENVRALSQAAQAKGVTLGMLVEVDVGQNRCGVRPGAPAVALARAVEGASGLRFKGLMGYEGHTVFIPDREERRRQAGASMKLLTETVEQVRRAGLAVEVVSAGGTGTYDISCMYPEVTEIQAGSYILMDTKYRNIGIPFGCALTVLSTVVSRPTPTRVVVDAGKKVLTEEFGLPEVKGMEGASLKSLSEEHGTIELASGSAFPRVGDRVELVVSHCCTTINLHDHFYAVRDGVLEAVWEIAGRGMSR